MSAVQDVLSRVRISEAYTSLTGITPRQTGRDTWRGSAPWRGGDGQASVAGDDGRCVWHDFVTDEGGGLLDLVIRIRGGNRADALRWVADLAGIPLTDAPLSPEDRARWARDRREMERDLPAARWWRDAAVLLGDEVLDRLKVLLWTACPPPEPGELRGWWLRVERWRRLEGDGLVREYRAWRWLDPVMTAGLVHAGRERERRLARMILDHVAAEVPHAA